MAGRGKGRKKVKIFIPLTIPPPKVPLPQTSVPINTPVLAAPAAAATAEGVPLFQP